MRKLLCVALLSCALGAQGQGTFQFQAILTGSDEVPPNGDSTVGTGTFWFDGNLLNFLVNVPSDNFLPQSAYIQGPALPGANGPIIFDLGSPKFHSGSMGDPPFASFGSAIPPPFGPGPLPLTDAQIPELESGLWYVNVTSAAYPDGQLRGQILPVPEPSALALLGLGAVLTRAFCRPRRHT